MRKQAREGKGLLSEIKAELKLDPGIHEPSLLPERGQFLPGGEALAGDTSAPTLQLGLGQQEFPYLGTTLSGCRQSNPP